MSISDGFRSRKRKGRRCRRPFLIRLNSFGLVGGGADAHAVEAAVDEDEGDGEEDGGQDVR